MAAPSSIFLAQVESQFQQGRCCAEAILAAYLEVIPGAASVPLALASGLCGGLGDRQGSCGALTGAILVAGLSETDARVAATALSQGFRARFGSLVCADLLARKPLLQGRRRYCLGITLAAAALLEDRWDSGTRKATG